MSKFKVGCNVKFKQKYHVFKSAKDRMVQTIDVVHKCSSLCKAAHELGCSGHSYHFKGSGVCGSNWCEYSIEPAIDFIIRRSNR